MIYFVYILTVGCLSVNRSHCVPIISSSANSVNNNSNVIQTGITPPEVLDFMRKFGYLESRPSTSESLLREDAVIAAIKNVQKFGAINETGMLDNATLKLLAAPRCGVADIKRNVRTKRFAIGSHGWQKRRITYFIANWSPKVGEDKVASGMKTAFNLWSRYSHLRFVRVYDPDADIIVAFGSSYHGDNFPFDGPGNVLAHAFYPYEMSSFGGDIHFDNDENWKENSTNLYDGVDFESVAIHELGHSLGLAHSPVHSSIMFPYYKGPDDSKDLNYDDIMAMYELYIKYQTFESNDNDIETTESDDYETTTPQISRTTKSHLKDPNRKHTTTEPPRTVSTFDGDFESIDKHKRRFNIPIESTTPRLSARPTPPNLCESQGFDAVALLRGEIFIFKNEYLWRLTDEYRIAPGYPIKINEIFTDIPDDVDRIDAAYERKTDSSIILFHGREYWVFDGYRFIENSPKPITDFGFDEIISKIDAAFVWSKNWRTYLFAGTKFVRFDEESRQIDESYPANISDKWRGVPNNIDAAISVTNGKTYFFKGNLYWLYNNHWVRPVRGYPRRASTIWLGCPLQLNQLPVHKT